MNDVHVSAWLSTRLLIRRHQAYSHRNLLTSSLPRLPVLLMLASPSPIVFFLSPSLSLSPFSCRRSSCERSWVRRREEGQELLKTVSHFPSHLSPSSFPGCISSQGEREGIASLKVKRHIAPETGGREAAAKAAAKAKAFSRDTCTHSLVLRRIRVA